MHVSWKWAWYHSGTGARASSYKRELRRLNGAMIGRVRDFVQGRIRAALMRRESPGLAPAHRALERSGEQGRAFANAPQAKSVEGAWQFARRHG